MGLGLGRGMDGLDGDGGLVGRGGVHRFRLVECGMRVRVGLVRVGQARACPKR